ncbi:MAG TPA: fumarylacetoacetase, partial [Mycobacterium sp.]|nr:fumarylacetoacetase [Mycobacterium sp.]
MTISVLRTADAWWVATPAGAARVATSARTTAELLADRAAVQAAAGGADTVPVTDLELLSPVTTPCRVVAQM